MNKLVLFVRVLLIYLIIHSAYYFFQILQSFSIIFDSSADSPAIYRILMLVYTLLLAGGIIFSIIALQFKDVGRKGIVAVETIYIAQYLLGLLWYSSIASVGIGRVAFDIGIAVVFILIFTNQKVRSLFTS